MNTNIDFLRRVVLDFTHANHILKTIILKYLIEKCVIIFTCYLIEAVKTLPQPPINFFSLKLRKPYNIEESMSKGVLKLKSLIICIKKWSW